MMLPVMILPLNHALFSGFGPLLLAMEVCLSFICRLVCVCVCIYLYVHLDIVRYIFVCTYLYVHVFIYICLYI